MSRTKDYYWDEICANSDQELQDADDLAKFEALYGNDDFTKVGLDLVYQYGRYAKTLESVIEAQEDFLRLTNGSKETSSVASGTVPALAS